MRKLTIADIGWSLVAEAEDIPVRGNALASGDDAQDKAAEDAIIADLDNGNEWAWCCAVLTGRWNGLEATECLGGCSYSGPEEFKKGGYYEDMQATVLEQIQDQAEDVAKGMTDPLTK